MPQALPVIGAVATVAGTVLNYTASKKAADLSQQQQAAATRRSQLQALRGAQIQRAQAVASAQAQGSMGSSGAAGGIGALGSQLGSEMGYASAQGALSARIGAAQSRANLGSGLANLGANLYDFGLQWGKRQGSISAVPDYTRTS